MSEQTDKERMDRYDKLMVIWACAVCITAITGATFSCADDRRQIVQAIEAGTPAVLARCAIKGPNNSSGATMLCDRALKR